MFDQVYNKIPESLARIGKVELKNIQWPVEVYRIILGPKTREEAASKRETLTPTRHPSREQQRSIAVLPFVNMSSDRENEFLSDGISEDLLNALSWIEGLHVAASTSCFAFKGRNEDIRKIGDALGVETVLEGRLRRVGTKLRITAQLIKIVDGFSLWSERFDREMQDVFAIQDDITRAIMAALKVRFAGRSDQPLFKLQTTNAEAYELYLRRDDLPRTGRPRPSPGLAGEGLQRPRCLGSHAQSGSDLRGFTNRPSLCRFVKDGRTATVSQDHSSDRKPDTIDLGRRV